MELLWFLLIGLAAGFIAGKIMRGRGFGLLGNLGVGVVGAFLGSWIFDLLDIYATSLLGQLAAATVGAVLLLWIVGLIRK